MKEETEISGVFLKKINLLNLHILWSSVRYSRRAQAEEKASRHEEKSYPAVNGFDVKDLDSDSVERNF